MPRTFTIRPWQEADLPALVTIWNQVVEDGVAFPQEDLLTEEAGRAFFAAQSRTAVAVTPAGEVLGLYILHPNNIGRCGHIGNASYAVRRDARGRHVGEALVRDSLAAAPAGRLYERLGFVPLGTVPGGFRLPDGSYSDICLYYHTL